MYIKDIEKWIGPYFESPNSGRGGSESNTESDADFLGEDDNSDDNKSDDDKSDEDSKDDKSSSKKDKSTKERKASDSKDDESEQDESNESEQSEDEQEDEEEAFGKEFEEKNENQDETEEIENEFTVRALKKEFPKIFQKFPEVKDAIFREREFTKIYGSIEDAQEAAEKAQYLDEISQELFEGKPENLIKSLKKNNEESLKIFAHTFLPELYKVDKQLYTDISDRIINTTLRIAAANAAKNGNKNLGYAVKYLSNFIFGDFDLPELKDNIKPKEKSEAERKLEEREQNIERERYQEFEQSVHSRARARLEQIVVEGLDPDDSMSKFTKEAISDKIIEKVGLIIAKDQIFQSQLASLWKKAQQGRYNQEAKSRIISAYLARARKIVPSVRNQVRKDATSRSKDDNHEDNNNRDNNGKRQATSSGSGKKFSALPKDPKKIPSNISDEDILAMD